MGYFLGLRHLFPKVETYIHFMSKKCSSLRTQMNNHSPEYPRQPFEVVINYDNSPLYASLNDGLSTYKAIATRFLANIEYLRTEKGESAYRMLKNIRRDTCGFCISAPHCSMVTRGMGRMISFQLMIVLCSYFGADLFRLMSVDIRPSADYVRPSTAKLPAISHKIAIPR